MVWPALSSSSLIDWTKIDDEIKYVESVQNTHVHAEEIGNLRYHNLQCRRTDAPDPAPKWHCSLVLIELLFEEQRYQQGTQLIVYVEQILFIWL